MGLTNRVLRQCNVARATEKEAEPNGSIEGLGRHASSALQRVGPSLKAVFNAFTELLVPLDLAAEIGGRPYWMPRERMAKLAGRLGWVAESTYGGKLRTGAFWWAAAEAERHGHAHVNIRSPGLLQAASWWTDAASGGRLRGDVFVPRNDLLVSVGEVSLGGKSAGAMLEDLHLAGATVPSEGTICSRGDASGKSNAWAAILGSCALHGVFSGDQLSWGIDAKEMWVIRCLMKAFPELLAGRVVALGMDNAGNQFAINSGKASSPECKRILAEIYDAADELRCRFYAVWIPRAFNRPSDLLCKTSSFLIACRDAEAAGLALHFRQWTQGRPPA